MHLALADSYQLYTATLSANVFAHGVTATIQSIPKEIQQAVSPAFLDGRGPPVDNESKGFLHINCFTAVPSP